MDENVIRVCIKDRQGQLHEVEAPTDMNFNMMEISKANDLPVKGTCGGTASCASCHMYVLSDTALPSPSDDEEDMLDSLPVVTDYSRLSCQIIYDEELDGLELRLTDAALPDDVKAEAAA